jgi:uncharacterized membrane protein
MSNPLQVVLGVAIVFLLPGYTLVNLLFPRRGELDPEYDQVYRMTLGMGMSIVISILVGFGLNAISTAQHGYVSAGPLWAVLLSLTGLFAAIGWLRGAYPSAGLIHPSLYRSVSSAESKRSKALAFDRKRRLDRLILEREQLLDDIKVFSERSSTSNPQRRLYYRRRIDQTRERIDKINDDVRRLGSGGD